MATPRTVAFHTLGCKLNYSETSALARLFEQSGYLPVKFEEAADIFVLNTCSVTEQADKECKKIVRQALRRSPDAFVVVTGCYAQLKPQEIAEIPGVDLVLGAGEKFRILDYVDDLSKAQGKGMVHAGEVRDVNTFTASFSFGDRTRSFLKVQDGCDYKCSFCTIPQARGASRSDTVESVLQNARNIADMGVKEIVLTGVNLGDFGNGTAVIEGEKPKKEALFVDLVRELDQLQPISRFRISSIEPNLLTEEIIQIVSESERFMPHFHVPLQSGNDKQLRDMRRRYKRQLYADRVEAIRKYMPDACIGCDVIVGFPGETEEDFLETYQFISDLDISYLHVFTYSERANTLAATMEEVVSIEERKRRNHALRGLSEMKRRLFYSKYIGTERPVLFEQHRNPALMTGFTDNYIKIEAPLNPEMINQIGMVELQELDTTGEAVLAKPLLNWPLVKQLVVMLCLVLVGNGVFAQTTRALSLQEATQLALTNSAQIKKAQLDKQSLEYKFKEQRAAALPTVKAGVNLDIYPFLPTTFVAGNDINRPNESFVPIQFGRPFQLTGGIQAEQLLYSDAGRRMLPAADITRNLTDLVIERSSDEVMHQTAMVWFQMLQTTQLTRSIEANLDKLEALKKMAELQLANGYITSTDVKRIKVAQTNLQTQKQNLLNGIAALRETLQFFCGIPYEERIEPKESTLLPASDSAQWLALSLDPLVTVERRFLTQQENLNTVQANASQVSYRPTITAYSNMWLQNQSGNLNVFGHRWYGMAMVGVKAQTTLFDGFRSKYKLEQLKIDRQKIQEDIRQLEAAKTLEFRQAKTQLTAALGGLNTQNENVALAKEITEKLTLRYKAGEVPLSDLLNAQTARSEAETNYWQQVFTYKLAVLRLAKVTGKLAMIVE